MFAPLARELDSEWAAAKYHFNDAEPVPSLVTFSTKGDAEAILGMHVVVTLFGCPVLLSFCIALCRDLVRTMHF